LYNIKTCGDLRRYPVERLEKQFGIDDSPVVSQEESEEVKSVGHSILRP